MALKCILFVFLLCIKYNVSCLKTIEKYLNWENAFSEKYQYYVYLC